MNPSWSIFDCRQLVSFRLPLTVQELAVASGRFRTLVLVLAYSGLRFGEAVALRRRDIDLDAGRIWVTKSATHVAGEGIVKTTHEKDSRPQSRWLKHRSQSSDPGVGGGIVTDRTADRPGCLRLSRQQGRGDLSPLGELRWAFDKGLGAVRAETNAKRQQEIEETGKATTKEFPHHAT